MTITNTTGRDCLDSRCPGPLTWERTKLPRTGRPKTGVGHRDDAMLDMLEFRQRLSAHAEMEQRQYRERRDSMTALAKLVDDATVSWRYGEIVDGMTERVA